MPSILYEAVGNVQAARFSNTGDRQIRTVSKIKRPASPGLASVGQVEEKPVIEECSIPVELAIIVPVYNEAENIIPLVTPIKIMSANFSYDVLAEE